MSEFTKDPSTHPANGPLTEERLIRVRDALAASLEYAEGSNRDHMIADAVKAIIELLSLRKAPQLPQPAMVPTFDEWCAATDNKPLGWVKDAMREAYDGCRAAMLQGAEPVSQPFKLRDGWVAVPVEPTENMVIAGFEAELREELRDSKAWEAFEAMSGCEQAAHRAKWCWAAMITAAPQQEAE